METKHMKFLWVHWFGCDPDYEGSFETCWLYRIGLTDSADPSSYKFLNPSDVLRAVHLIPAFSSNKTNLDRDNSDGAPIQEFYYISIYGIHLFHLNRH
jgi:hypothetical protein